jgi:molecular chaperone HtpG
MQKLETTKENISFARVDADHIDNLIKKEDTSHFKTCPMMRKPH